MDTTIIFLILGLILLLVSGKYIVESSVVIARHFKIPTIIIGLTIVAFGTSAPELLVSLQASIQGHPDMALGNVIGSNISNILLVLAITAFIFPITISAQFIRREWPIMMFASCLLVFFLLDLKLSRLEGIILLALLVVFIIYSIRQSRDPKHAKELEQELEIPKAGMKWWVSILVFFLACIGLAFGADLLVDNASTIARKMEISERVISISMVAVGTSLPELATSMIAAFKKESNISVGNIIGSNIMNIITVLGVTATISPISTVKQTLTMDLPWMIGAALLLYLFMIPAGRGKITRFEGAIMLLGYFAYIMFIFIF